MKKNLILPLEIKDRELWGALSMTKLFVKKKWTIYLGQKQQLFPFIKCFSSSVWFLKSIVPGEFSLLKKIKKNNHFISTLDIEGLNPMPGKLGVHARFSENTIEIADQIFFWSKYACEQVTNEFLIKKKKYLISGSPNSDAWKYFKNEKNKKILFLTSFPLYNNYDKKLIKRVYYDNFKKNHISDKNLKNQFIIHKEGFKDYKKILIKLLKKNFQVTIRPHPSEKKESWENIAKNYKNASISKNKDINDEISKHGTIIHFNSTAAIQSAYYKKNIIMYFPKKYFKFRYSISPITLNVSLLCRNIEQLIKNVNNNKKKTHDLKNFIHFSKKKTLFSTNKIFKKINNKFKGTIESKDFFQVRSLLDFIIYEGKQKIAFIFAIILKTFKIKKSRFYIQLNRNKFVKYKWNSLTENEIKKKLKFLKTNSKDLENLVIKRHFSGAFKIYDKRYN